MVLMSVWRVWRAWCTPARRSDPGQRVPAPAVATGTAADELPAPPERPWGCGWFDSSLDLREGLAVIEHEGIELGLALELMFDAAPRPTRAARQACRPAR